VVRVQSLARRQAGFGGVDGGEGEREVPGEAGEAGAVRQLGRGVREEADAAGAPGAVLAGLGAVPAGVQPALEDAVRVGHASRAGTPPSGSQGTPRPCTQSAAGPAAAPLPGCA